MIFQGRCSVPECAARPVYVDFEVFVYAGHHEDPRGAGMCSPEILLDRQPHRNSTTRIAVCHVCGAHGARFDFARTESQMRACCPLHP
jgi:hypothetical protein